MEQTVARLEQDEKIFDILDVMSRECLHALAVYDDSDGDLYGRVFSLRGLDQGNAERYTDAAALLKSA